MLTEYPIDQLNIEDEDAYGHVALYQRLRDFAFREKLKFVVAEGQLGFGAPSTVLNLAFYQPGGPSEVLPEPVITADQLTHNAWHRLGELGLGDVAASAPGQLLVESVASAFDLYIVGRLLAHRPDAMVLETQVPAMFEAAAYGGFEESQVEAILARASEQPERCFGELQSLLFETSIELLAATSLAEAAAALKRAHQHGMAPLLHHYELPTWVLTSRAASNSAAENVEARGVADALAASPDPIAWLEAAWPLS